MIKKSKENERKARELEEDKQLIEENEKIMDKQDYIRKMQLNKGETTNYNENNESNNEISKSIRKTAIINDEESILKQLLIENMEKSKQLENKIKRLENQLKITSETDSTKKELSSKLEKTDKKANVLSKSIKDIKIIRPSLISFGQNENKNRKERSKPNEIKETNRKSKNIIVSSNNIQTNLFTTQINN